VAEVVKALAAVEVTQPGAAIRVRRPLSRPEEFRLTRRLERSPRSPCLDFP
jgi:hypothetical protein